MTGNRGYQSGFGNEFATEAVVGALPQGRNSPQRHPLGLYTELISGTAFTAPRAANRRTWVYRRHPSVSPSTHVALAQPRWTTGSAAGVAVPPDPLRWHPFPIPETPADFFEGLHTVCANGDAETQTGMGALVYLANRSMERRVLIDTDGELLIVPQQGRLEIATELGVLDVVPGEVALVPRGIAFRVGLPDGPSRGYACENYGAHFRLPELGPIGSNGLANPRDFLAPVAACDDTPGEWEVIRKFRGGFWRLGVPHSPLDVVAWHGNLSPVKYDTANFMTIGSISFDHPDPSIFTVVTSPSDTPGVANCDFVIFPPRWLVAEDTFRPPWYHRNVMSEFMGLVHGVYDAKPEGFQPGGASLHNAGVPHGPDRDAYLRATGATLAPHKLADTLAFMFESRYRLAPTAFALTEAPLDAAYARCWADLPRA